jgi:hypothetical protein
MLKNILRSLGLARPAPRRHYGRMGGGAALPLLAMLGWRYRDRIRSAYQGRFGRTGQATTTTPGYGGFRSGA